MPYPKKILTVYIAKPEFINNLCQELNHAVEVKENLILSEQNKLQVCFAQDIWLEPQLVYFESISEAVKLLRQAGKFWYMHPISHIRRARLIEQQLRKYPTIERHFPIEDDIPPIGGFCLLDQNTLLYSAKRLKKWPDGACFFIEDKINPPNRAYLKLWEAITLLERYPSIGETALDLGASPGGWTYVMQSLGTTVTSVDKAPLDPKIKNLPRVHCLQQSAFALDPATLTNSYDWVLSDIACYPERAYTLIMKWINSGRAKQMIFTIKLQGEITIDTLKPFQEIANSSLINLYYNKHEATFFYPALSP
jgi:23S rRNA (cytidine2498-2'-O)-methyltransferase